VVTPRIFPDLLLFSSFRPFTFIENILHQLDFTRPPERAKHDKLVSLVEQTLKLHKDKAGARLG